MYCKKCGKPITSIATECPYCHEKVVENINNSNNVNNNSINNMQNLNSRQYTASVGSIILTIICIIMLILGVIQATKGVRDSLIWAGDYYGMNPTERQGTGTKSSQTYKAPTTPSTTHNSSTISTQNYQ